MNVQTFPVGPLGCNCSIVWDAISKEAVVIDPGGDFEAIRDKLTHAKLKVVALVHTHTHIDHVGATAPLQRWTNARACIHEEDRFLYDMLPIQAAMLGMGAPPEKTEMEGSLHDNATVRFGGFEMGVLHTPGHTPGSVCFQVKHDGATTLFTGDTLFRRGIGRTDLWGGDSLKIIKSLRERLLNQEEAALVVPGHGPNSTIGEERRGNPFLA